MDSDSLIGIFALLVFKVLAHFFAVSKIARIYGEARPPELAVITLRTSVGLLAGMVYAPIMSRYELTPWSQPGHPWIFLAGVAAISLAIWWWCVLWFFHRRAMRETSVIYPVLVGAAWSFGCDLIAIFRLIIVEKIWPI
ncbi:MAG: hypothetical protein EXS36_11960 [Pedosphaera sp.]|nr:hypothetical protein [Pedosphaera sp.]